MEYITTKEASAKWGISTIRITVLANEGRIAGAQKLGKSWLIPATATKPQELKPNQSSLAKKEAKEEFSFPLYHFRPDWSYIKKEALSDQQQQLLEAEGAVLECRFDEAYKMLGDILQNPESVTTEIGCLWSAGICSIALNKPKDFNKNFFRIQMLMSKDIPHREDLQIILDSLKTYTENLSTAAKEYEYNSNINDQCLPTACLLAGYSQLTKEAMTPSSTEVSFMELNLRFVKNTGAVVVAEFLHLYMVGIYYLQNDIAQAEKHAKTAIKIAYENKYYFPLVTYYRYLAPILAPILEEYPEDFQKLCGELISDYNKNFSAFLSSITEYRTMSMLKDTDFPYIYAVLMNLSNNEIAERMNISPRTVKRRLDHIFKILNVGSKKELKEYLKNNM